MQSIEQQELTILYAAEPASAGSQSSSSLLGQVLVRLSTSATSIKDAPSADALSQFRSSTELGELLSIWLGDQQLRQCATTADGPQWLKDQIDRDLARIQGLIERQLNTILHAPAFQKLEASWRGLDYLISTKEKYASSQILIKVFNCRWSELGKNFENSLEFDQSQLFKKVYEEGIGQSGENPFSAIILDYSIHPRLDENYPYDDMTILREVAQVAAAAFCPVIANAHPSLLAVDNFSDLKHSVDFDSLYSGLEFFGWQKFREDVHSRFVALAMPHMLMRQPYREVECQNFLFSEQVVQTSDYLWGGAAFAAGEVILKSFAESGWYANIRGASYGNEGGGLVLGPAQLSFDTEPMHNAPRPLTDFVIDDIFEHKVAGAGFLPLCSLKNTSLGAFYSSNTCQKAKVYNTIDSTMSAKLSTMLNYMLCASRFAHYLKRIARDKVGSYESAEELESILQKWINQYVSSDQEASAETRGRKPLFEAEIKVSPIHGRAGEYQSVFHIVPHYELDDMIVAIALETRLIPPSQ